MTDLEHTNFMIESNMGLVYMVAKKFSGRGVDFDDIVQIGSVGLIKASKNYNPEYEVKFSTYAVSMIFGEIKRYFRDDGIIKIPRKIKEVSSKIKAAAEILRKEREIEPTIYDLCEYTGFDAETIVETMEASMPIESIYAQINDDTYILDTLKADDDLEMSIDDKLFLKEMLEKLDARGRQIILLRFFKEQTQQEIAKMLGISQVQVSRLEKKALQFLRDKSNNFN